MSYIALDIQIGFTEFINPRIKHVIAVNIYFEIPGEDSIFYADRPKLHTKYLFVY